MGFFLYPSSLLIFVGIAKIPFDPTWLWCLEGLSGRPIHFFVITTIISFAPCESHRHYDHKKTGIGLKYVALYEAKMTYIRWGITISTFSIPDHRDANCMYALVEFVVGDAFEWSLSSSYHICVREIGIMTKHLIFVSCVKRAKYLAILWKWWVREFSARECIIWS